MVDVANLSGNAETFESLDQLKYNALRSLAKSRGLKANGAKGELIERILDNFEEASAASDKEEENVNTSSTIPENKQAEAATAEAGVESDTTSADTRQHPAERLPSEPGEANSDMDTEEASTANPQDIMAAPPSIDDIKACSARAEDFKRRRSDRLSFKVGDSGSSTTATSAPASGRTAIVSTVTAKPRKPQVTIARETLGGTGSPAFATRHLKMESKLERPKATPSSRFARAHQNLFAGQRSIEAYGKTPKNSGTAKTPGSEGRVHAQGTSISASKFTPRALLNTSTCAAGRPWVSGVQSTKKGRTVASKPCTLVVQPSKKKTTQVKAFSLSSSKGKREGFTFKPYSGRVRPIDPVLGALADRSYKTNVVHSTPSVGASQGTTTQQLLRRNPAGIKCTLASDKAQVRRRAAHFASGKSQREKRLTERRARAA